MPREAASRETASRETAIAKLVNVFRHYGYEGATLSRLSEATGLGRASLYHHFPKGKEEMAKAVLEYVGHWFEATVLAPLQSDGTPKERLRAMCDSLNQFYNQGRDACLLCVFTLGECSYLFELQVKEALTQWIDRLTQLLIEAGQSEEEARQRSQEAVMQIQGALVLARGLNTTEPFERTVQQLPSKLLGEVL